MKKILTIIAISAILITAIIIPCSAEVQWTPSKEDPYKELEKHFAVPFSFVELREHDFSYYTKFNLPTTYYDDTTNQKTTFYAPVLNSDEGSNYYVCKTYTDSKGLPRTQQTLNISSPLVPQYERTLIFYAENFVITKSMADRISTIFLEHNGTATITDVQMSGTTLEPIIEKEIELGNAEFTGYIEATDRGKTDIPYKNSETESSINIPLSQIWNGLTDGHEDDIVIMSYLRIEVELTPTSTMSSMFDIKIIMDESKLDSEYIMLPMETALGYVRAHNSQSINMTGMEDLDFISWISMNMNSFFSIQIVPNITIGGLLWVVIGISALFAILKVFLGG